MSKLQPVRGTHDVLGDDARKYDHIIDVASTVMGTYNFERIATPIFEFTNVFARTLGEESDIVHKEMYTFEDRGGESLTLRPENTASVVRALLSNGLTHDLPLKLFYHGPMFRYERPQKGRQRQFHQVGCELFGANTPQADAEIIKMGQDLLHGLGIQNVQLHLNTLGDAESRTAYRDALVKYFSGVKDKLSEDSQRRLESNPLRILDSKDEGDKELNKNAPRYADSLNQESKDFFAQLQDLLAALDVSFTHNETLVRGLDYYTHTVFEFISDDLGAQGTVLAGGRYDGLVETMGGPSIPGVGWGAGIERLSLLLSDKEAASNTLAVIPLDGEANTPCITIANDLRQAGFAVDMGYSGNMKKRFKRADKIKARFALLMGEDELAASTITVRDLISGDQTAVSQDQIVQYIEAQIRKKLSE